MSEALTVPGLWQGTIVRARSGYYDVSVGSIELQARPRGRLRLDGSQLLTGDRVTVAVAEDYSAVIEQVEPRTSYLPRPPVANVDQVLIVFTLVEPPWNRPLIDRISVLATAAGLDMLFCVNKTDLVPAPALAAAARVYEHVGSPVVLVSALQGSGLEQLVRHLHGRTTVLAGQSGVGKSTLINALQPGLNLEAGAVSRRLRSGRHTTRQVELLTLRTAVNGQVLGYVVDTPGFSRLDLDGISSSDLAEHFPEFRGPAQHCRFDDCRHRAEPQCGVKRAVAAGQIDEIRYDSYLNMLAEIEAREANVYG